MSLSHDTVHIDTAPPLVSSPAKGTNGSAGFFCGLTQPAPGDTDRRKHDATRDARAVGWALYVPASGREHSAPRGRWFLCWVSRGAGECPAAAMCSEARPEETSQPRFFVHGPVSFSICDWRCRSLMTTCVCKI